MHWLVSLWWGFQHAVGIDAPGSRAYNFWSGFGSDLGEITIVGGLVAMYRQHECHQDGCHRVGKFPFEQYKLCRKHHPSVPNRVTHAHIAKLYTKNKVKEM